MVALATSTVLRVHGKYSFLLPELLGVLRDPDAREQDENE